MSPGAPRARWAPPAVVFITLSSLAIASRLPVFTDLQYAIQRTPELTASSLALPERERARGTFTLSMYVRPEDLYSPDGMLTHVTEHGRKWERPAWVSFYERGRVTYSGRVGVRVHGGGSRLEAQPQSFRLFFRKAYGSRELPPAIAFGPGAHAHPLKRLVVHNDVRDSNGTRWHFSNPLAYDIARAAGAIVSETRPVRFFLNGELQGVYVLKEHFDPDDFFETHWGHAVRLNNAEFDALWSQVQSLQPLTMRTIAPLVDLDNLTRWFISSAFCNTRDAFQGPSQFRDPTRRTAQWFFVNWDMDESFRVPDADSFDALLEKPGRRRGRRANEVRPRIMTALLREDPEYRAYFARVWVDVMNHAITPEFLRERYDHYARVGAALGEPDREYLQPLKAFLDQRPAIMRVYVERLLQTGPSVSVRVGGGPVEINGHRVTSGWEGYYFPGMPVSVRVPDDARSTFGVWRVNGQERREPALTVVAGEDTLIEAVSAGDLDRQHPASPAAR
jgi:hypothetical protein